MTVDRNAADGDKQPSLAGLARVGGDSAEFLVRGSGHFLDAEPLNQILYFHFQLLCQIYAKSKTVVTLLNE